MIAGNFVPLGYQQITALNVAVGLTLPTTVIGMGGVAAVPDCAVIVAETQAVRWRDDGTNPSATVGEPLAAATELFYTGNLNAIKFFEQTASAKLNVSYYKRVG